VRKLLRTIGTRLGRAALTPPIVAAPMDAKPNFLARHARLLHRRAGRLDQSVRALIWSVSAGLLFVTLNSLMRGLALQLDPFLVQFLRYLMGVLVMLPFMLRAGLARFRPRNISGQFARGAVHTSPRPSSSCWARCCCSRSRCAGSAGWRPASALPAC